MTHLDGEIFAKGILVNIMQTSTPLKEDLSSSLDSFINIKFVIHREGVSCGLFNTVSLM